ncbi:MAG: tRNA pseudouridine(55) synthase TruB [Pseudomonadota bacterium]|nr:tRNA pseudouridine(55) synthase TruB [Pseudomonadota bacterium]
MVRKKRGKPVNGWLVLDKSAGLTSAKSVFNVRKILKAQKAGHAGTLDPMATGILPIALGEATKTVPYLVKREKNYRFTAKFGEARDTDDSEGAVIQTSDTRPENRLIKSQLNNFLGDIWQVPPIYSALWVDGERSYKRARNGTGRLPAARKVNVKSFSLLSRPDKDTAIFEVTCGKGTYIRSLVRDLGVKLGTVAYVSELRRTSCGPFIEKSAISLDKLAISVVCAPPQEYLLSVSAALDDIPALALTETQAVLLRHGRSVQLLKDKIKFVEPSTSKAMGDGDVLCAMSGEKLVALVRFQDGEIRPIRVLNL